MVLRPLFILTLLISIFSLPLSSYPSSSLRGQPGHIVRLVALTPFAPGSPSPSRYRSFFPIYFLPLLQPSPSASPLLRPCCLSRCLPKVAWPNAAAPSVDITQSGCLPPCQTPLAVRRLCSSAITARCSMSRLRFHYRLLIFSEPRRIDQPVAYCPACLPALSSSLISLPHLPPSTSFTSPISLPVDIFVSLMLRWLLSLGETLLVLSSIPSYTCILPCL